MFLIGVVLLQQGKGADMGAVFGGSSSTIFGSGGAGNFLTRLTTAMAIIFMLTSLTLTYTGGAPHQLDGVRQRPAPRAAAAGGTERKHRRRRLRAGTGAAQAAGQRRQPQPREPPRRQPPRRRKRQRRKPPRPRPRHASRRRRPTDTASRARTRHHDTRGWRNWQTR